MFLLFRGRLPWGQGQHQPKHVAQELLRVCLGLVWLLAPWPSLSLNTRRSWLGCGGLQQVSTRQPALSYARTLAHGRPARAAAVLHSLPPKGCCLSSRSDGHVRPMRLAPASQRYLQPDLKREGPSSSETIAARHGGQNPSVAVPSRDGGFTRRGAPSRDGSWKRRSHRPPVT